MIGSNLDASITAIPNPVRHESDFITFHLVRPRGRPGSKVASVQSGDRCIGGGGMAIERLRRYRSLQFDSPGARRHVAGDCGDCREGDLQVFLSDERPEV